VIPSYTLRESKLFPYPKLQNTNKACTSFLASSLIVDFKINVWGQPLVSSLLANGNGKKPICNLKTPRTPL